MLDELNLKHLPDVGKDADVLEPEDVDAAAIAAHQALRWTMRQYQERCMRESLTKRFVRHTRHLVAMQSGHIARVLDYGRTLLRLLTGNPPKEHSEEEERRRAQRMRKIEFALLMHECAKFNPKYPGGVNPNRHLEETCDDTLAFLADVRRKRKPLAEEIATMVEVSGSPYSTHGKRTGVRAPDRLEEAIVHAAVNFDATDFWGAQHIVWIRQHPERLHVPSFAEPVGTSLIFAKNMRDEAMHRVWNIKFKNLSPSAAELIVSYGTALWKRSERFFAFFDKQRPKNLMEFRTRWNEFFRQELEREHLGWVVSRRNPVPVEQGS